TQGGKGLYKFMREGAAQKLRSDALDDMKFAVGARVAGAPLNIPALGGKVRFQEAVDKLEKLKDRAFPKSIVNLSFKDRATMKEAQRLYAQARQELPRQLDM